LEVSLRERMKKGELNTVSNDFMPPYTVMLLSRKELIEEKIKALFIRKKPRDFYDFYFFIRSNILTAEQKKVCRDIPALLRKSDISFQKELKEFLPKSHWPLLHDFPAILLREIQRFL
jgi:predicted nucleotidyltransferase component of viral defense system